MIGLASAASALSTLSALATPCPSPFYLEPQPVLTLDVINKFVTAHVYQRSPDEPGGFVVYPFDDEDHPYRKGRMAVAVIVAENGDLAVRGLGGLLWSSVPADVDETRTKALNQKNGKSNLVFVAKEGFGGKACAPATFTFTFDYPTGNLVAQRKKLGSLNDPPR